MREILPALLRTGEPVAVSRGFPGGCRAPGVGRAAESALRVCVSAGTRFPAALLRSPGEAATHQPANGSSLRTVHRRRLSGATRLEGLGPLSEWTETDLSALTRVRRGLLSATPPVPSLILTSSRTHAIVSAGPFREEGSGAREETGCKNRTETSTKAASGPGRSFCPPLAADAPQGMVASLGGKN